MSHKDRHGERLLTVICENCGLICNSPVPTEEELGDFYKNRYRKQYKGVVIPKLKHHYRYSKGLVASIKSFPDYYLQAERVLDIGCGGGEFVSMMKHLGKKVEGIEPAQGYAKYISDTFGVNVFCGSVDDFISTYRFDLVRMNHVLEHMRDPVSKLKKVRTLLAENGKLFIEVPNFIQYCETKSPGGIFHYGHIYNFDALTLKAVAAKAGFKVNHALGPTSIFFEKSWGGEDLHINLFENASNNKTAFYLHMKGYHRPVQSYLPRLLRKQVKQINELIAVRRLKTPEAILSYFSQEIAILSRVFNKEKTEN